MDVTTLMGNNRHKCLVQYLILGPEGFMISLEWNDSTTVMLAGGLGGGGGDTHIKQMGMLVGNF